MNISVVTVFKDLYTSFLETSLIARAQKQNHVSIAVESLRSFVAPKERIDAPVFGPGAGMLIKPIVVERAIEAQEKRYGPAFRVFFSPKGERLTQELIEQIIPKIDEKGGHLMLLPARYEGMDARVEEAYADLVLSMGDFVLLGGDLPAMMLLEGLIRLLPGVVGKAESIEHESFKGPFVDYPSYTEPVVWQDKEVPAIVRSGNHQEIAKWRQDYAVADSVKNHFGWVRSSPLTEQEKKIVADHIPNHYVALMHTDVLIGSDKQLGTTSVTSIDIHDISRSSRTYGISEFFIVTSLQDQQKIVRQLLSFWSEGYGLEYNKNRSVALQSTSVQNSLTDVLAHIQKKEGVAPLIIATSARDEVHSHFITYEDQKKVWKDSRPILFLFGTGRGLSPALLKQADYLLNPIHGFTTFNHLSVRSAVAIILDRWLGINERKTAESGREI